MTEFEKALNTAKFLFNKSKQVNIYAIIKNKKGIILSHSTNSYTKTHPLQKECAIETHNEHKIYLHAEIAAIIKAKSKGHSITIIRLARDGITPLPSYPCPICMEAIKYTTITQINYLSAHTLLPTTKEVT